MKNKSFKELVDSKNWSDFTTFLKESDKIISQDIEASIKRKKQLRQELLSDPDFKKRIKKVSEKDLEWAKKELFGSNVCAVDGTISNYSNGYGN